MSTTPRTDKDAVSHIGFYSCATVPASLCRCIETELTTANARIAQLEQQLEDATRKTEALLVDVRRNKGGQQSYYDLEKQLERILSTLNHPPQ